METIGFGNLKQDAPNGIAFRGGQRALYFGGQVVGTGVLGGEFDPYDYFYHLRFLEDFPAVRWWAFGDAWTQRIMVKPSRGEGADILTGLVHFGDEEDAGLYVIERAYDPYPPRALAPGEQWIFPPWVQAPLPGSFDAALNLPLRLLVARAVTAALDDNWPYDQWMTVTSVLDRIQAPQVITADVGLAYGFRIKGLPTDLRQALCELQGLRADN